MGDTSVLLIKAIEWLKATFLETTHPFLGPGRCLMIVTSSTSRAVVVKYIPPTEITVPLACSEFESYEEPRGQLICTQNTRDVTSLSSGSHFFSLLILGEVVLKCRSCLHAQQPSE